MENTELVNRRLAKEISLDEYIVSRRIANDDAAECKRRKMILENEIGNRKGRPLPDESASAVNILHKTRVAGSVCQRLCGAGCPRATKKIALLPAAWGEKNSTTSSS